MHMYKLYTPWAMIRTHTSSDELMWRGTTPSTTPLAHSDNDDDNNVNNNNNPYHQHELLCPPPHGEAHPLRLYMKWVHPRPLTPSPLPILTASETASTCAGTATIAASSNTISSLPPATPSSSTPAPAAITTTPSSARPPSLGLAGGELNALDMTACFEDGVAVPTPPWKVFASWSSSLNQISCTSERATERGSLAGGRVGG